MAQREIPVIPHDQARNLKRMMASCIKTLLDHDNSSRTLDLDRIARFQQFDPTEFRAAFLSAETERSMRPRNQYDTEGK